MGFAALAVLGVTAAGVGHVRSRIGQRKRQHASELQRARENGVEEGFEIGYQAHLKECGVAYLPGRRRRRRLMGDS